MSTLLLSHPACLDHLTPQGIPNGRTGCARSSARWRREVSAAGARAGADGGDRDDRARASDGLRREHPRCLAARRHGADRRRHHDVAGHVRGGAARGRRRRARGRRGDDRQGGERVRGDAPARPSCRDRDADGLLPVQQCRHRGAPCAEDARRRARRDRRFRRPPRQRQPGHFLGRRERDVLLDPPDAALSRHRRGVRARRAGHHRQCAAQPGRRRRRSSARRWRA